jgi:hypothetical protein
MNPAAYAAGFFTYFMVQKKRASREGGCTNQIPLTIKPYPMKNQI